MNRKQVIILVAGIALLTLSELFLPWQYTDNLTSAHRSAGYHFITVTPHKTADELRVLFGYSGGDPEHARLTVNSGRVTLQRLFIALFTYALVILYKPSPSIGWKVLGGFTLLLGLLPLILWIFEVSLRL